MNPTLFEIGVAIVMVAVSVALVVSFARYLAAASGRRAMLMLARVGLNPDVALRADTDAVMQDVRRRCRRCPSEGYCDRWLAGEGDGDNSFCPNAPILRKLATTTGRAAT